MATFWETMRPRTWTIPSAAKKRSGGAMFSIVKGGESLVASTDGEFLFLFEKDLTIELQKLRCDLFFIHSEVLSVAGAAIMLVGASGSGKSTTAWALSHHGYQYMSDELAPVDLNTFDVHPYPHALCLKQEPPGVYPLPITTLYTTHTLHVPVEDLPTAACGRPTPLMAIFFACYCPELTAPTVRPLGPAEGAARLFAHSLNPLAHPGDGLEGSIAIALRTPCFELFTADLPATCALVQNTLERLGPSSLH
jgi:hypothetical protein